MSIEKTLPAKFDANKEKLDEAAKICDSVEVSDLETLENAIEIAKNANNLIKAIEAKRKELKEPSLEEGRLIDKYAKDLVSSLDKSYSGLRKKIESQQNIEFQKIEERKNELIERKKFIESENRQKLERLKRILNRLNGLKDTFYLAIKKINSAEEARELYKKINNNIADVKPFEQEYLQIKVKALDRVKEKGLFLEEIANQKATAEENDDKIALKNLEERLYAFSTREEAQEKADQVEAKRIKKEHDNLLSKTELDNARILDKVENELQEVAKGVKNSKEKIEVSIVDESSIPLHYREPSMKLINEAIKSGVENIPGVEIVKKVSLVLN